MMKLNRSSWYKDKLGLMMAETAKLTTAYSCGKLQIIMTKKKKTNESAQEPCIIKIRILILVSTKFNNKNKSSLKIRTYIELKYEAHKKRCLMD